MVHGIAYMAQEDLTPQQSKDLRDDMAAASYFWEAAQAHWSWREENLRPHGRCIYSALAVCDILHAMGRTDAYVVRTGLDLRGYHEGRLFSASIGTPGAPRIETKWNAHAVVRMGDIILDPSIAQTQRPWNKMPHFAAFLANDPQGMVLQIENGRTVPVRMVHRWEEDDGCAFQLAHFKLPLSVDLHTRNWRRAPDALPERRKPVVDAAVELLRTREKDELQAAAFVAGATPDREPVATEPARQGSRRPHSSRRHLPVYPSHREAKKEAAESTSCAGRLATG